MKSLRRIICLIGLSVLTPGLSFAKSDIGVLILSHGGTPQWNKTVKKAVKEAELPYPTRIFFGMGDSKESIADLQDELETLDNKGVTTIIAVPLLISSYSEVYRQWRFLLGLDVTPGFTKNVTFPLQHHADIQFATPFNDDPIITEILLDRVREISQTPERESVIIVAHGPNDDVDNREWLQTMGRTAARIKSRGGFQSVEGMTIRDDAPPEIRSEAVRMIRERVEGIDKTGTRALVIPLLLATGGIENKISLELKGTDYIFNAKPLLPDKRISQWIRSKVP